MQFDGTDTWRLQVVAEVDPGALVRVLQLLQSRNLVPRRVSARHAENDGLSIQIDVDKAVCTEQTIGILVAKANQIPTVIEARCECSAL